MRRIVYSVAISLDGYIADAGGGFDWIVMDPDMDFGALMARFDTFVMGRRTWELTRSAGGGGAMPGTRTFVVSRTLAAADHPDVTVLGEGWQETVRALREEAGKEIWLFGGGELFAAMLDAGLVDAVEVGVVPVLLGGGVPMLKPPAARARLRLTEHRVYPKSRIVRLAYEVVRDEACAK